VSNSQLNRLTATELNDKISSGAIPLKSVRGMEKAYYILTRDPIWLFSTWMEFFVSSAFAAFLGGVFVTGDAPVQGLNVTRAIKRSKNGPN
jgi:hypothetical protein